MISIKKYLEGTAQAAAGESGGILQEALRGALRSTLTEIGNATWQANALVGLELKTGLAALDGRVASACDAACIETARADAEQKLRAWGARAALHLEEKTGEVKDILLLLAQTAENLAQRDQRCAAQMGAVTTRLKGISTLDDLSAIRASIADSASALQASIDRMATEGRSAVELLRSEMQTYQTRLEAAEYVASCDSLTGLGSRAWLQSQIEKRIACRSLFSVVLLDIDEFKTVNDVHGHVAGDEVLKQFAREMKSACRSTDVLGRWGGDEFIVLLDCGLEAARAQTERLEQWVCGNYELETPDGLKKLRVHASFGLAASEPDDTICGLIDRADKEMYRRKHAGRAHPPA